MKTIFVMILACLLVVYGCALHHQQRLETIEWPGGIVGDYEVISYETVRSGLLYTMPMVGDAYFRENWSFRIRMRPDFIDASSNGQFLELHGLFYYNFQDDQMTLHSLDDSEWIELVRRYRIDSRPNGEYLVLIQELPKDELEHHLDQLKDRNDENSKLLIKKYQEGLEWIFKKK